MRVVFDAEIVYGVKNLKNLRLLCLCTQHVSLRALLILRFTVSATLEYE